MMHSLKGCTEILPLWYFEQGVQVPPKPVSRAQSEHPCLRHPIPMAFQCRGDPWSICRTQCGKKIRFFHENRILFIWRPPWQIVMCLWDVLHLHKWEQIETTFDFNTMSVLQLPTCISLFWFTSSQSNLDTHLQRWTLQRSPQGRKSHCFRCCSNTYKASKELTALWNTSQTYTRQFRHGK